MVKSNIRANLETNFYFSLPLQLNHRRHEEKALEAISKLAQFREKIPTIESIEVLLGYEGQGAHLYFQALGALIEEPFVFTKRVRRPPTDPVNSLLSLGYTLVFQNMYSLLLAIGLHPHFGNLHVKSKNHPALVSDLIEEWRAPLVDSLVTYLVNYQVFSPDDFSPPDERGGVYLYPDALKKFLKHWQEKLNSEITHPQTGYKVSYYRCLEFQIWEYISYLTGKIDIYRPIRLPNKW